ncbi:DUF1850 domain-containing protein [Palaeococcus ferrophilus]|uniref:DUF1850 domain-containing protein n=1 Tax=Palaeococcus ferrophilus TaxID=83868 RepID=UPI0009FE5B1C|nr:DUF1850 domain-containing protein [Palaeococcus ferrophilus]
MRSLRRPLPLLFAFLLVLPLLIPVHALVVSDGHSSRVYRLGDVRVEIDYIHSVERSEIREVLEANSSGLYAKEMWWKDFGAGLPEDIQYMEDGFYVKKINIPLGKSLDFWFIPLNRAEIKVNGETIFAPKEETLMRFRVKRCPLFETLVGRC